MNSSSSLIAEVTGRQILDSRGRPTVEADVRLEDGTLGRACAPSGASRGRYEAFELRDGDPDSFAGLGVQRAVANVRQHIFPVLRGRSSLEQVEVDLAMTRLDGTQTFQHLGANAVLAVSMAVTRAGAAHAGIPLYRHLANLSGSTMSMPMPMTNILSGGAHAGYAMDLQDFLAIPVGADSYMQALEMISRVRSSAATLMSERNLPVLLADEGGLSPGFSAADRALEFMILSFERAGLRPGQDVAIAIDVAASELFEDGIYLLEREGRSLSSADMVTFISDMARRYPIVSIEDGLDQDDWDNWRELTCKLPGIQLIGDDLFATNIERITQGVNRGVANAALIKLNQNGTVSGTLAAIEAARKGRYACVISARSGETEDHFIADLAVGTGAGQIKIGSVRNSERLAKYNQLLRIEEESGLPFARMLDFGGSHDSGGMFPK